MNKAVAPVSAQYSFNVARKDDVFEFTYKRARYGIGMMLLLFFAVGLPAWYIFYSISRAGFPSFVVAMLGAIGIYLLLNASRKQGMFSISPTHFTVDGREYSRGHVFELFIQAGSAPPQVTHIHSTTMFSTNAWGGVFAVTNAALDATKAIGRDTIYGFIREYGKKNFRIGFIYGESRIKLAGGLSASSAESLYREVLQATHPQ